MPSALPRGLLAAALVALAVGPAAADAVSDKQKAALEAKYQAELKAGAKDKKNDEPVIIGLPEFDADEIKAAGAEPMPLVADVTRAEDMDRFVAAAVERFGRLDVMTCNAGFGVAGAIDDVTPEQMRTLMDVNYTGTFFAARSALRVFRRQGHGHVVIVSSIVGKRGVPYMGAYAATKFAQVGLAECLRAEVADLLVRETDRDETRPKTFWQRLRWLVRG